jgi:hypothetical protein
MTAIVGIHGVGNYRAQKSEVEVSERLAKAWTTALSKPFGLPAPDIDLRVAYYAPHLRVEVAQGDIDPDQLDPDIQRMILEWVDQLDPPTEVAMGRGTQPIRQALEWVADRFGLDHRLVQLFVTVFFREVATYFHHANSVARSRARDTVTETITIHQPRIVIAHSLGSVVAYEALWAHPDLSVDLLLTLGSPLAMPDVVFPHLDPAIRDGWGQRPPSVTNWINLADPGDLIAIPRQLASRFRGINADLESSIHVFDFHRVINYLASPTTAAAIAPYLKSSP